MARRLARAREALLRGGGQSHRGFQLLGRLAPRAADAGDRRARRRAELDGPVSPGQGGAGTVRGTR